MQDDMTCRYVSSLIPRYLEGKCTEAESMLLTEHCALCPGCRSLLELSGEERRRETVKEAVFLSRLHSSELSGNPGIQKKKIKMVEDIVPASAETDWTGKGRKKKSETSYRKLFLLLPAAAVFLLLMGLRLFSEDPGKDPGKETLPETGAAAEEAASEVMSYAGFMAAKVDDPVTVETFVHAKQGWWE